MRLPPLPSHLETKVKTLGAIAVQNSLIQFWSSHLLDVTNDKPTKTDYFNIASSIIESFADLRGGKNGHGIIKQQLTTHIRNRRANMKRHGIKRDVEGQPRTSNSVVFVAESSNDNLSEKKDIEDALIELEKIRNVGDCRQNYQHIRRLLQETLTTRRMWIEKEAKNTIDILFEFSLMKKLKEEIVIKNVDAMIKKLALLFEVNIKDERDKSDILIKFQTELLNKRFSRNTTPLITVKESLINGINNLDDQYWLSYHLM
ncbi:tyrosine recombinase [Lasius niger]|uniref:Tyrosine recombinase n=1 Tax=Lasius niger TaxID=67767 RepID=A0A0J7K0I4_LASNI|nr:tyrosine recombinase [Lasius niger]